MCAYVGIDLEHDNKINTLVNAHTHTHTSSSFFSPFFKTTTTKIHKIIKICNLLFSSLFFFLIFPAYVHCIDGKFILELARSKEGDRGWISVPRKTYWPPAAALSQNNLNNHKNESSTSLSCKCFFAHQLSKNK